MLGRTLIGERVWDVHKAIYMLSLFPQCDTSKILITGNSGGGTLSFYSAVYDKRIKLCVPSCSFSPYKESIIDILHCNCNYMPNAYLNFNMQDLASLIAPRNLIVVAGVEDEIFPINGVKRGVEIMNEIYEKAGSSDNVRLVETPNGHLWREDIVWREINAEL